MAMKLVRLGLAVSAVMLVAACAMQPPLNQPAASAEASTPIKAAAVKDGKAHIYAFLGTFHNVFADMPMKTSANFTVNGITAGGVNRDDCLFIEVPPGTYSLAWQERAQGPMALSTQPTQFKLAADQNLFVAFDVRNNGLLAGFSSSLVDRSGDGVGAIRSMKVVLPDAVALTSLGGMAGGGGDVVNLACTSAPGVAWNVWIDPDKKVLMSETLAADGSKTYTTYPVQITDSTYSWDDRPDSVAMNVHRSIDRITGRMTVAGPNQTQPPTDCLKGAVPMPVPKL